MVAHLPQTANQQLKEETYDQTVQRSGVIKGFVKKNVNSIAGCALCSSLMKRTSLSLGKKRLKGGKKTFQFLTAAFLLMLSAVNGSLIYFLFQICSFDP